MLDAGKRNVKARFTHLGHNSGCYDWVYNSGLSTGRISQFEAFILRVRGGGGDSDLDGARKQ